METIVYIAWENVISKRKKKKTTTNEQKKGFDVLIGEFDVEENKLWFIFR